MYKYVYTYKYIIYIYIYKIYIYAQNMIYLTCIYTIYTCIYTYVNIFIYLFYILCKKKEFEVFERVIPIMNIFEFFLSIASMMRNNQTC